MSVTIYHNPRCSKSRQALQLLIDTRKKLEIIEYLNFPPTPAELLEILTKLNMEPTEIVRTKEAKETGINCLNGINLIEAISQNPCSMQRPIIINGDKAVIGRPPERIFEIL